MRLGTIISLVFMIKKMKTRKLANSPEDSKQVREVRLVLEKLRVSDREVNPLMN